MKFIIPENEVKVAIKATNRDLNDRFSIFNMDGKENCQNVNEVLANGTGANFSHFARTGVRPFARTKLFLGYDESLLRPVIIKTPKYRDIEENRYIVSDYEQEEYINFRREMIRAQVHMLNEIRSPLLPEPIDYFEVENTDERIPGHMRNNEPVLILDYQSGTTLQQYIQKRIAEKAKIERKYNNTFSKQRYKKSEAVEIREKFRIVKNIVIFLKALDAKNYAYQGLNTKSILLQRDKTPRFIGLGFICKTKDGHLDENHINYRVCELGYSAPELNNTNIPIEKITAKGVSAFSLGVLIHQLVGEYLNIDIDILGEYGHLKYPNEKTVKDIKTSALKGELVHQLIANLCEEDVDKRLTDFDEILNRIEIIIGGKKRSSALKDSNGNTKKYDKYTSGVQIIYGDTEIKHCEEDNSILKDITLGVGFYCKSKNNNLGFLTVPGHLCEKCGKAYITEDVYIEEIEETLEEIYNREAVENNYNLKLDENDEKESIYINKKDNTSTYKQVSKITKVNFKIEECIYDDEPLELFDCAIEYYKIGDKKKEVVGKITTKLLACGIDSCNKVYISERKLEELRSLLPDRNIYDFDCIDYKEELSVAYKLKRFDNINYCNEDLTKLKSDYVRVPFYVKDNPKPVGYKVMKLNYCPTCKTYYISRQEEKELKARGQKSFNDAFLKIKGQEKRISEKLFKLPDNFKKCESDKNNLVKENAVINLKKENSKKSGYRILAEVYVCKKCKLYYIKHQEIKRINELAPKGYKIYNLNDLKYVPKAEKKDDGKKKPPTSKPEGNNGAQKPPTSEPLTIRDAKAVVVGENMLLCTHDNNRLTREIVDIPKYEIGTDSYDGKVRVENKLYCSKCARVYLNEQELKEVNSKLKGAYIEVDKSINIKSALEIIKTMNSIVKKFMK